MRHQRGEVAARAGGDPAAEGRVLERLREVPERELVLAQLVLEARARSRPPGSGPRARSGRSRAPGRAPSRPRETRALEPARLDAAHDARAAAVGDHGDVVRAGPVEQRARARARRAGAARRRAGRRTARGSRARRRGRPCRARATRARSVSTAAISVSVSGTSIRGGRSSTCLERHRLLDLGLAEPEVRAQPERGLADLLERGLLVLVAPPPVLEPPSHGRSLARRGPAGRSRVGNG